MHGVIDLDGTQDEPVVFELGEPELQGVADADGEERRLRGLIGNWRIVMTVDDDEGIGGQRGLHAGRLLGGNAHGDEAHPSTARGGAAGAHLLEDIERKL